MPVTIDATPGSASANSYGTLSGAESYFLERLGGDVWATFTSSPDIQSAALITATRSIDAEVYRGNRVSASQSRQFPRTGLFLGGQAVDTGSIPRLVEEATYEEALALLTAAGADGSKNPLAATGLDQFSSLGVGDIKLDMRDPDADNPARKFASPQAYRLLRPYLLTQFLGVRASVRNVRIIR